jgi:c-di-GMP-binding flagellar brake protein YcgR
MDGQDTLKERRRSPRLFIELPLEYRVVNAPYSHGGLVVNVSEVGLLINSIKNMPVGTKLNIEVLFPKEFELANFKVLAEIIWKDIHFEEDGEEFRYGLKFIQISEEDRLKLKQLLNG